MENWLLISNCNTYGLAHSLTLLSNSFNLDRCHVFEFKKEIDKYRKTIPDYDRVIINPDAELVGAEFDFSTVENLNRIPTVDFDAYHPDLCYLNARGNRIHGPTGGYHSMLTFGAFEQGLSVRQTQRLFRGDVFERCGFFARWQTARDRLLKGFELQGLDISGAFRQWTRGGQAFMYGLGHPRARPIHDIARIFIEFCGITPNKTDIVPYDTLVDGVCLPVYSEIGEIYGVKGSYMFKPPGEYRLISLEQFIEQSFQAYSEYEQGEISAELGFRSRYETIKAVAAEAITW